jgi:nucleoside-diphosphate-sugar epimerase
MRALIGHTGFVGSNLLKQAEFDRCYNSKNIEEIVDEQFELVVCAGVSSIKWKANKHPKEDFQQIQGLIENLEATKFKRIILISTIAVYDNPADNAYGRNRLYLETYLKNNFDNVSIVRLPSLFGSGLKKNAIYDLINKDEQFLPHQDSTFQYYCLDTLWQDIQTMQSANIKTLNISTEPIVFRDILKLFQSNYLCSDSNKIVHEDMRSVHAAVWGKQKPYLYDRIEIINNLERFIKENV